MGLTDSSTFVVAILVTTALFVLAVAAGPRLTRRYVGALARALLILAFALGAVVSSGLKLNADNGWYTSWSDLAGDSSPDAVEHHVGPPEADVVPTVVNPSTTQRPATQVALPSPGKRDQHLTLTGQDGLRLPVLVRLPPTYFTAPSRRYPVLFLYHGFPGVPDDWLTSMRGASLVDDAVAAKQLGETIVVIPQLNSPAGRDGECMNGPAGTPQLETWVTKDVPDAIDHMLRTVNDRSARATMGFSAGGYCSALAGVLHPDRFGASIVLSGYFRPTFEEGPAVLPSGSTAGRRYDLVEHVRSTPPRLAMWVQAGRSGEYWPQTEEFLAVVHPPLSVTTRIQDNSGHRWDVWRAQVPHSLTWLGHSLPGFHPAH